MTSGSGRRREAPRDPSSGQEGVPDAILLLAAVDRAARHGHGRTLRPIGQRKDKGRIAVPIFSVASHLGYAMGTRTRRRLNSQLDEATEKCWLEVVDGPGPVVWTMTSKGRRTLARNQGKVFAATRALPESPQHQTWREALDVAGVQIEELRAHVREALDECSMVAGSESTESAVWLRLADASSRLGAATYCLFEWHEPDDAQVDVEPRPERRTLRNWRTWAFPLSPGA